MLSLFLTLLGAGLLSIPFGFALGKWSKDDYGSRSVTIRKSAIFVAFIALFTVFSLVGSFNTVDAGEVGVVKRFGAVTGQLQSPGFNTHLPYVESVTTFDVKTQKDDVKASAASKDLQDVTADIVINWHLNADQVFEVVQNIGDSSAVRDRIIVPAVNEVVKAATATKSAEEVLTRRPELKANIDEQLKERLKKYYVVLDDVSIVNVTFSPDFNKAIEDKQVAEQNAQKAKFTAQQAEQEAIAEVNRAKGAAEAQGLQRESLTPEIINKMAIEKWNGQLPTYMTGDSVPFINLNR